MTRYAQTRRVFQADRWRWVWAGVFALVLAAGACDSDGRNGPAQSDVRNSSPDDAAATLMRRANPLGTTSAGRSPAIGPESEVLDLSESEAAGAGASGADVEELPTAPEQLVGQRWFGMEWPTVSASDLGLSTDPGMLEIVRHTGADLHAVSASAARYWLESLNGLSATVVLVSGETWHEIAVAASLAGRVDAPMLVLPPDGLGPEALAMLETAQFERAVLVGDRGGALQTVQKELDALGVAVEQIAGDDVFATASAVARFVSVGRDSADRDRAAVIVSAADPSAAAVATSLAAANNLPLLLTPAEELHPNAAAFIVGNELERVLLIGTIGEFSAAIAKSIETTGARVVRLSGGTPYELALSLGRVFEGTRADDPRCLTGPTQFALASLDDPLHALVAAPLFARLCAPLLYAETGELASQIRNDIYLARHRHDGAQVHVFADAEHIPDSAVDVALPPIRLAFPVTDPAHPGTNNTMAVIDEQRNVTLHLQGESFAGINWLAWSPNAPRLAFAATQHGVDGLFLLEPDIHAVRRLTPADRTLWLSTWAPAQWSPTGTHIAMSAYDDPEGNYHDREADLYLVNVDSGAFTVLAETDEHDQFMQWNPAGNRILFLRHDQFGLPLGWMPERDQVFLADILDRGVAALDLDGQALWHAQWSPDSSVLAMALVDDDASQVGGLGTPRIRLVASDPALVDAADDDLTDGYILGWSTDGSMLGVSQVLSDGDNYQIRIATADVAGRQLTELIEPPDLSPHEHLRFWSWAPHHNALLFDRYNTDTHNTDSLLLIDAEWQSLLQLPGPIAQVEYRPFGFSPEGSQTGSTVYSDVWLIVATDTRADGSERLLLDITEYRGQRTEQWADIRFLWNQYGLSGTIEWYADY